MFKHWIDFPLNILFINNESNWSILPQILCGGKLPFIGLVDKVEQELYWKVKKKEKKKTQNPNLYMRSTCS